MEQKRMFEARRGDREDHQETYRWEQTGTSAADTSSSSRDTFRQQIYIFQQLIHLPAADILSSSRDTFQQPGISERDEGKEQGHVPMVHEIQASLGPLRLQVTLRNYVAPSTGGGRSC